MLLHDEVIEVAPWINGILLVKPRLLHVVTDLVDEVSAQLEKLIPGHLVVTICNICRSVGETCRLEESEHERCVPTILHIHQTFVVDRNWQLFRR